MKKHALIIIDKADYSPESLKELRDIIDRDSTETHRVMNIPPHLFPEFSDWYKKACNSTSKYVAFEYDTKPVAPKNQMIREDGGTGFFIELIVFATVFLVIALILKALY